MKFTDLVWFLAGMAAAVVSYVGWHAVAAWHALRASELSKSMGYATEARERAREALAVSKQALEVAESKREALTAVMLRLGLDEDSFR